MKHSKYNFIYKKSDRVVVFNTYSTAIMVLSLDEFHSFENLSLSSQEAQQYYEQGFIIEDDVDELANMLFDNSYYAANGKSHYRILTTTSCNAHCEYCYENGIEVVSMNDETAIKTVDFIEKTSKEGETVHLEWFGGEPLVNSRAIITICQQLKNRNLSFKSSLVTNGIILNEGLIKDLINVCNVSEVQITLDGIADIYAKVKHVPQACFYKVIDNILALADRDITVHIRMNYTYNTKELTDLIAYLKTKIGFHSRVFYYVYPIFEHNKSVPQSVMDEVIHINDLLLQSGLMKSNDFYKFSYREQRCFAVSYNSFTISPDGKLFNCSHVMNDRGYVGTISNYSYYHPNRIRFTSLDVEEECIKCLFYPICKGGCKAAETDGADINQCFIYKSCMESILDRITQDKIKEVK